MGYSTREIAELMGIRQGAVLTRLHRARLKLKEIINADGCRPVLRDNG
jgi:DNA-directed RNA polymerase specialized sigma24 family protein